MLSVIVATHDSARPLVATLAALVPGAIAGVVSEVLVADGGSRDDTAVVAEVAGCNFLVAAGSLAERLQAAAARARGPWLLFLRPGTVLDAAGIGEARRFMAGASPQHSAAVFRRTAPSRAQLREALALAADALGRRPGPDQGLLIAKEFYAALGGHAAAAADAETDLIRRVGRRRIVRLAAGASRAPGPIVD